MNDFSSDDTDIIPVTSALSNIIRRKIGHDLEKIIILREVLEKIEISEYLTEGKHDNIYISNIVPGDAIDALNGALNIGDTIFSINKESFIGISYEKAKQKIKKLLNNREKVFVISFFPNDKRKYNLQRTDNLSDFVDKEIAPTKPIQKTIMEKPKQNNYDDKKQESINNQQGKSKFYIDVSNQNVPEKKNKLSSSKESINDIDIASKMIAIDQLESALIKIGFFLTDQQAERVRENLQPDVDGKVKYEDFVKGITSMLLKFDKNDSLLKDDPTADNKHKKDPSEEQTSSNQAMFFLKKIEKLTKERDAARKREQYLKNALMERDRFCLSLKDKLKASYQTIEKLEEEMSILLKDQEKGSTSSVDYRQPEDVVLYNLHQSETQNRAYEVCISKLMKFVEKAQSTIKFHLKKCSIKSRGRQLVSLVTSAGEVMDLVKTILVEEPLPYGWEKVFSTDNNTYFYINHSTQQTSWIHPVTGVKHLKVKSGRVTKI